MGLNKWKVIRRKDDHMGTYKIFIQTVSLEQEAWYDQIHKFTKRFGNRKWCHTDRDGFTEIEL